MTLSLDSNLIIDVINGASQLARDRYLAARAGDEAMVLSSLVFHEVAYGAAISKRPRVQAELLATVVAGLPVEPFTEVDAAAATRIRLALRETGTPIGGMDNLIAGQALARGWTVVTANTREFDRVQGLKVMDWSRPTTTKEDSETP